MKHCIIVISWKQRILVSKADLIDVIKSGFRKYKYQITDAAA